MQKPLQLRFLGEIEIQRGGQRMELPPSKKTRALLAYLAVTRRRHRRDRLCSMFWDVPDDPRAALRWSLSKLRPLVDEPGKQRIVAGGEGVAFELAGARVDLFAVVEQFNDGRGATVEQLAQLAREFRGEFLEGLELPDFHDFQAWCVAQREEARRLHARILAMLVEQLGAQPDAALPYARTLAQVDPFNEHARAVLVRLLGACGRRREAEQQFEAGSRVLRELGAGSREELGRAWQEVSQSAGAVAAGASAATAVLSPEPESLPAPGTAQIATFVGHHSEWSRLTTALEETVRHRREHAVLLNGEPGVGKTRLLIELMAEVRRRRGTVLYGGAYEAETGRPYGPWIDALRRVPAVCVGDTLGADLAPLLPELGHAPAAEGSRDRLFGAVAELIAARAHSAPPVVLGLDDVQWCDGASAELLHYVARMNRHRPVVLALAARDGELQDNEPMRRVLRGLRHDDLLDEIRVGPLSREETALLVRDLAPSADLEQVFVESAGNPLLAIEVARSLPHRQGDVPPTLRRLVRDRIERLAPDAADVLRWGAVVGQTFCVRRLSQLAPIDSERVVGALEILERHALLRAVPDSREPGGTYAFAHDVVRQVVYAELSTPRRRLMHLRIARVLQGLGDGDETVAAELVHHAALAGEADIAARACVAAGRHCLRLFASSEADALARRGMHHAERLPEPDRVKLLLELTEIRFAARRPPQPDEAAHALEQLAERALDHGCLEHARLGFHLLSYLRWEGGEWSDAQRHMMRAEQVSRSADERERVVAIAEAARCLTLLERDLGHAEALLLEAGALSRRLGVEPAAIPDAVGMLRLHEGRLDEAAERFTHARDLCRKDLDRLGEFRALEHLVVLELQRECYAAAQGLSADLVVLGDRLREGSEAPSARALAALSGYALGAEDAGAALDAALAELRVVDAKHRLTSALVCAAGIDTRRGDAALARQRAEEALRVATVIQRPSEIVLARVAVARAAGLRGDAATCKRQLSKLHADALRGVSFHARKVVERLRAERLMPTRSRRSS